MSITWIEREKDETTGEYVEKKIEKYVGRVMSTFQRDLRAMSDVYTDATYAHVVEDDFTVKTVLVNANFELDTRQGHAEVDLSQALRVEMDFRAQVAKFEADIRAEEERRERLRVAAIREANRPVKGKRMRVTGGRKVPKGTTGTVAFVSNDGESVLLKDDDKWQDRKADGQWVKSRWLEAV